MRLLRLPFLAVASLVFCCAALSAQSASVAPRITAVVDESSLAKLGGNVPSLARSEFDQGEVAPGTQLTHVRLVLSRSSAQQAGLDAFEAELQDSASPNYHKWLTPDQFGRLYGPADADIATLVSWLQSHGLTVESVSPGRTNIAFSGPVSAIETAFHTSIHTFIANGQTFTSNTTDPQIPAALATVVRGVAHLNTIHPRSHRVAGRPGTINPQTRRLEPISKANPNLTISDNGYSLYVVPGDAATIYDTPNSYNANFSSGTSYTGSGVKIGVGEDALILSSTVVNYRNSFLGNSTAPTIVNVDGVTYSSSNGDLDEAYLDTEIAGALAPAATIYFYVSSDLYSGIERAISDDTVNIFSLSFGNCEQQMSTSDNQQINGWWEQAAAEGIAVTVSAGDSGSAGCDNENSETVASQGLAVSGFASTPYNIAVGGTDYYPLINSYSSYVSTSEGSSATYYRTAEKYIPESTWNDSTTDYGFINSNVPESGYYEGTNLANIVAGSGGASNCSTNTSVDESNGSVKEGTCTSGYSKPSWQTGTGVPADGERDIPDVSFLAGNGYYGATWLVCTDDTGKNSSGVTITLNCAEQSDTYSYFTGIGGTSASSPAFAGILALLEQKTGSKLGLPAKELYTLFNGSQSSSVFHDVTVGNNSVPCSEGTSNCALIGYDKLYYFEDGYNTATGYDLATGLGSVDATSLLNNWNSTTGTTAATVNVTVSPTTPITINQSLTISGSVTASGGTPTGSVTLSGGGYTSASQTLSSGAYSFTVPANSLEAGSDVMTVSYSGSSTYALESGSVTVTVNVMTPTVTVNAPSTGNTLIAVSVPVTVTGPSSGTATPTGTVSIAYGTTYASAAETLSSGSYTFSIPASSIPTGNDKLVVTYSGDSNYGSGTGNATVNMITVTPVTPTVTVNLAANASAYSGQSLSVPVTVSGTSPNETYPIGTVTLKSGSTALGTGTLSSGSTTITVAANLLSVGADTLTATYSGDTYFATGSGSGSVTVTASSYTLAASTPTSVNPGGTTASTLSVSSTTDYSGTITLTCTLTTYPTNASDVPSCTPASTLSVTSGTASGTVALNIPTTAATSKLVYPKVRPGWSGLGGGAVLALLVFFGIPARRRSWRAMLGAVALIVLLGSFSGCGGGGSSGNTSTGSAGTTAGNYTFTVSGTGSDSSSTTASTTFTLTVN